MGYNDEKQDNRADFKRDNKRDNNRYDNTQRDGNTFGRKEKADPEDLIYGVRSVIEAIKNEVELNRILILKGMEKELFSELKDALAGKDFQLQFVPIEKLNKITSSNHQGVVAFTSPVVYQKIEDLADKWATEGKEPCVLVLDRITDVRNFGGIARTAACMGVDAILIPSSGSANVTADAVKTSAGALHAIPVCKTDLLKESLFYLQQSGYQIVSCTEKSKMNVSSYNFFGPTAIVVGSEENGIMNDLLKMSDVKLMIPMVGEIGSLNVGVATGMILYERLRQQKS